MSESASQARASLGLITEAEEIVLGIRESKPPLDHSYQPLESPPENSTEAQVNAAPMAQEIKRRKQMRGRAKAVRKLRKELSRLWADGLEPLAFRYLEDRSSTWRCDVRLNAPRTGRGVRDLCKWGCDGCCKQALVELQGMRKVDLSFHAVVGERLQAGVAGQNAEEQNEPATHGRLDFTTAVLRAMAVAEPNGLNWREVADATGYAYGTVREQGRGLVKAGWLAPHPSRPHAKVLTEEGRARLRV